MKYTDWQKIQKLNESLVNIGLKPLPTIGGLISDFEFSEKRMDKKKKMMDEPEDHDDEDMEHDEDMEDEKPSKKPVDHDEDDEDHDDEDRDEHDDDEDDHDDHDEDEDSDHDEEKEKEDMDAKKYGFMKKKMKDKKHMKGKKCMYMKKKMVKEDNLLGNIGKNYGNSLPKDFDQSESEFFKSLKRQYGDPFKKNSSGLEGLEMQEDLLLNPTNNQEGQPLPGDVGFAPSLGSNFEHTNVQKINQMIEHYDDLPAEVVKDIWSKAYKFGFKEGVERGYANGYNDHR